MYYSLYTLSLISGIVLASFIIKAPRAVSVGIIIFILVLTPINSLATASGYLTERPHGFISSGEIEGLDFLSKQDSGVVFIHPYDSRLKKQIAEPWPLFVYDSTAYVSAYSKKKVYLEDVPQNEILLTDYKKRIVASDDFFLSPDSQKVKFLTENKIKYIYIPKLFNQKIDERDGIKNIFENGDVIIYSFN